MPLQFIQGSLHADLNGHTINNGSVGTVIPELLDPIRSICLSQRHWGHLCPCRDIHHQGPAAQRDTHSTEGRLRTLTCHCNVDLSRPWCQLPVLGQLGHARGAQGLQAEGAVGAEVAERWAPARRLPPRQPLHVKGYIICAGHVGLAKKHSSTLHGECSTCSTPRLQMKPTHVHCFQPLGLSWGHTGEKRMK